MTKEELLIPRYKVIARWPNMADFRLLEGVTIELSEVDDDKIRFAKVGEGHCYSEWFNQYPHLFRCLEWYKDRRPEEMPEYVTWLYSDDREVSKASGWHKGHGGMYCYIEGKLVHPGMSNLMPADESEYIAYINKQK